MHQINNKRNVKCFSEKLTYFLVIAIFISLSLRNIAHFIVIEILLLCVIVLLRNKKKLFFFNLEFFLTDQNLILSFYI